MDKNNQEILFKLSMIEQQMQNLYQQLQSVERGMTELETLDVGLDNLKNPEGKEIFAQVGKGIFTKAKIISNEFIVDIGEKNFVKKSVEETKKLLQEQIKKLDEVKNEINVNIEEVSKEAEKITNDFQKTSG